ncbi:hypothetical protein [Microbispora sp. NPDC049125]|uniref:hypothetical protein n=1 Tax=Microbispora sp. NPDC049125 TaxID=3154929 RepID=UPI003467DC66
MNGVVRSTLALVLLAALSAACSGGSAGGPSSGAASPAAAASSAQAPGLGTSTSPSVSTSTSTSASPSPGSEPPAVTPAEARQAFHAFLATADVLASAQADQWALSLTRDGQRPISIAEIHARGGKPPPRYTWDSQKVWVPRQRSGKAAQWFAATAQRRSPSGQVRTAVMTFVRTDPRGLWQLGFESLLSPGQKPPDVALDADGYALSLDSRDSTVAISPSLFGPLHATTAEDSKSYASSLIAPGPLTTDIADEIDKDKEELEHNKCLAYDSIFAFASNFPVFALRTDDGGGLVLYTLIRTTTWSTQNGPKCSQGQPVPIPAAARWLLHKTTLLFRRQIIETQQYVGAVPPKASTAPAQVIGYDGTITGAAEAKSP